MLFRSDCYKTIALAIADPLLCNFLAGVEGEACIYKIARANKDINVCDYLKHSFDQDVCRVNIAKKSEDKSKCVLVQHKKLRNECLEHFNS